LFSGIGGIELGLKQWVKTEAYCEIDKYACAVLRSRMAEGLLDKGEIYGDIKELHFREGEFDIITGGSPCQDISNAGKRKGITAERSGLWFEMARLISEIRPRFVFVENVAAIINRGLDRVLGSLSEIRYDAVWTTLRASDVGAPHRRERFFLLAYPQHARFDASEITRSFNERGNGSTEGSVEACELEGSGEQYEAMAHSSCREDYGREIRNVDKKEECRESSNTTLNFSSEDVADSASNGSSDGYTETRRTLRESQQGRVLESKRTSNVPNSCGDRLERSMRKELQESEANRESSGQDLPNWEQDPADLDPKIISGVGKLANGLSSTLDGSGYGYTPRVVTEEKNRVQRIKCLGNGCVPLQAKTAFKRLMNLISVKYYK